MDRCSTELVSVPGDHHLVAGPTGVDVGGDVDATVLAEHGHPRWEPVAVVVDDRRPLGGQVLDDRRPPGLALGLGEGVVDRPR